MSDRPDSELVGAALGGETEAFGVLYDRYAALVRAICYDFTGEHHQADDLAQEVFMRAYRRLGSIKQPERFAGWLKGITRLVCLEWRRTKLKTRAASLEIDPPAAEVEDDEMLQLLEVALQTKLTEKERLAVHAYHLLGESIEQARLTTGLSRSGLFRVLRRAREKLRIHLQRRCGLNDGS